MSDKRKPCERCGTYHRHQCLGVRATPPSPSTAEGTVIDYGTNAAEDERAAFEGAYYRHWRDENVAYDDDWPCIFQRSDYDAERYMQIETQEAWIGWRLARAALAANAADSEAKERDAQTQAARDVLAERLRQVAAEGWTPEHDDEHDDNQLTMAAAWYALPEFIRHSLDDKGLGLWPWAQEWWKPRDKRSNLVRAGALVLAEIERLDRAAMKATQKESVS